MKNTIRSLAGRSSSATRLLSGFRLMKSISFLSRAGWFQSVAESLPVDRHGAPIPWFTYGAISFLQERVQTWMQVFEYGSGNSTLWWSSRVDRVWSCEHDPDWYKRMKPQLPANVEYACVPVDDEDRYEKQIHQTSEKFDIVVIDGRKRVACAAQAVQALSDSGVVIWDNAERQKYLDGYTALLDCGFKRIDFGGMGPINTYEWLTSVFYRSNNCLGI